MGSNELFVNLFVLRNEITFLFIDIAIMFIRDKMDTFDRGSSFSALQEASLWNRQTRETGPVS